VRIPPVVLAPLAGGPATPELAAAVANAGGLGFIAAGYLTPDVFADHLRRARALTEGPLGANLFVLPEPVVDVEAIAGYARELAPEAAVYGAELGQPRYEDDWLDAKLEIALAARIDVLSTTFAPPPAELVTRARAQGTEVWATVATVADASTALAAGADALVVQGLEAGGHHGTFADDGAGELPLLDLLRELRAAGVPLIAAGGIGDRAAADAARAAGAAAVLAGTAFLLCPEAGTSDPHRAAIARGGETAITRAFTGRRARGLVNRFMGDHPNAPSAYPHVHHLTAPLRAAARAAGDAELLNLWAGTTAGSARPRPAAEIVSLLGP
jgi:nitronate monooxygenase